MNRNRTKNMALCALFIPLMAVGAHLKIPVPLLPFTLQTFFTLSAGLLLGAKLGALSVTLYVIMGLLGLPFFTEGGGFAYVMKPSFGYLIGFIVGTFVTGAISHGNFGKKKTPPLSDLPDQAAPAAAISFRRLLCASLAGLAIVYAIGVPYLYLISRYYLNNPIGVKALMISGLLTTLPGDLALCALASAIAKRLIPVLRRSLSPR